MASTTNLNVPGSKPCNICEHCRKYYLGLKPHELYAQCVERPFLCTYCNRTFTRKDKLADHIKSHTGERPHGLQINRTILPETLKDLF
ncbi:zinc finger protein 544 [Nephila pilipes]|uniref:Zinc finger protein 544 n=1 Tax=Nephila pilipes TaxID=299642 RepID=A0A8X6P0Q2_NEPPI|nr:zinc finger protein 544 [Nephila pilipes]